MELIDKHIRELEKACAYHNVNELYAFDSVLTDNFNADSDIDFVASILSEDPIEYAENYYNLKFQLEEIFNKRIDLFEQKALRNKTFENILNKQKMLVYAKRNQGVA